MLFETSFTVSLVRQVRSRIDSERMMRIDGERMLERRRTSDLYSAVSGGGDITSSQLRATCVVIANY